MKFTKSGTIKINSSIVNQISEPGDSFSNESQIDSSSKLTNEYFLKISVIDTGIGIKREERNKLFKLFGYLENSNGINTHGIGLGLVIS